MWRAVFVATAESTNAFAWLEPAEVSKSGRFSQRQRWQEEYEAAKAVDNVSATGGPIATGQGRLTAYGN